VKKEQAVDYAGRAATRSAPAPHWFVDEKRLLRPSSKRQLLLIQ